MANATHHTNDLRLSTSYKQILQIALPISFAILIPQLNMFINTYFLGKLGTHELGDAGIIGVYYLVFSAIGHGLNNGLQSLISRKAGENDEAGIGKLFNHGVIIALCMAATAILLTYVVLPFVLHHTLTDATTIKNITNFLKIRIWGLAFLYMFQMRNAMLVGINQSKYLALGTGAETLVNVLLDYALIFGHFGLPQLGFEGAAVASVVAEFVGMTVTYFIAQKLGINKRFNLLKNLQWNVTIFKQIMKQSGPLILQHAISIISWLFFFILIGRMANSETNLAISNTMRNVFALFGVVTWALASTTNTMVSNIYGQGKESELPKLLKKLITIGLTFSCTIGLVLICFPSFFISAFSKDAHLLEAAKPVIKVVALAMILMSVSVILLNTVIGSGNTKFTLLTEIIVLILYLSYTYISMEILHVDIATAWLNEFVYWLGLGLMSVWFVWKRLLKNKLS